MPFSYPATEVFGPAGDRRVVFSEEGYDAAISAGYSDEKPEDRPKAKKQDK